MLDASALLWRLHLDGVDTGGRFGPLADAWAPKAAADAVVRVQRPPRRDGARRRRPHRRRPRASSTGSTGWLGHGGGGTNVAMTAEIGLPACRAVIAFAEDRHDDVVAELLPIRRVLQHFGGSHAQRDVLQRTLLESALRAGRYELAQVADRRAARRPRDAACTAGPSGPAPSAASATTPAPPPPRPTAARHQARFAAA